nr:MFS transporter [Lacticaseibacillus saniviri]
MADLCAAAHRLGLRERYRSDGAEFVCDHRDESQTQLYFQRLVLHVKPRLSYRDVGGWLHFAARNYVSLHVGLCALCAVLCGCLTFLSDCTTTKRETVVKAAGAPEVNPYRTRIILLLITLLITWITYEQWQSNISTYMLHLGMTVKDYSFLWTFNAVIIVIFQPVLTHFDDWLLEHINLRLNLGFVLFASAFLVLIWAKQYWLFLTSMGVLTLGEILALPAVSTFVEMYSPANQKGRYQGFVQVFASIGRALGPLIGALVIEGFSYQTLFIGSTLAILISVAIFAMNYRKARAIRRRM